MLIFGTKLNNTALFSVRHAGQIGHALEPIINPHNLHVDGFYVEAMNGQTKGIITDGDIRDFSLKGIIINDHQDITSPEDLVRLKPILDINFELLNKPVFANNNKIGKVVDFTTDTNSLFIQKLFVQPPIYKSLGGDQLIFDRQSIIEVTDKKIVVSGPEQNISEKVSQKLSASVFKPASTSTISE